MHSLFVVAPVGLGLSSIYCLNLDVLSSLIVVLLKKKALVDLLNK